MARDITPPEKDQLEALIDACGLCDVLDALSEICDEKAAHIEDTYSDRHLARTWRETGKAIGRSATTAATRGL